MSEQSLREQLIEKVKGYGHVSFAELTHKFFPEHQGDQKLELADYENVLLWTGMSPELVDAVCSAVAAGEVHLWPATDFTYAMDGASLNLPEAKRLQAYKEPHWVKMCLHHEPCAEAAA
jgi:hypothetical protein